jgi:hypothetical protein
VLQKSQKALRLIFRQKPNERKSPIHAASIALPESPVSLAHGGVAPTLLFDRRAYGSQNLSPMLQKSFVSPITNFPGCRSGDRILMWGTTSFRDELTADFGGAFDATSIGGCRLFSRSAKI